MAFTYKKCDKGCNMRENGMTTGTGIIPRFRLIIYGMSNLWCEDTVFYLNRKIRMRYTLRYNAFFIGVNIKVPNIYISSA